MRDLTEPVDDLDLIDGVYRWRETCVVVARLASSVPDQESSHAKLTSMHAEDLVVDDNTQGEEVEHVGKIMPDIGIAVFPRTFGVESV